MRIIVCGKELDIDDELAKRYCNVPLQEIDEENCIIWIENYYSVKTENDFIRANISDIVKLKNETELSSVINKTLEKLNGFCRV